VRDSRPLTSVGNNNWKIRSHCQVVASVGDSHAQSVRPILVFCGVERVGESDVHGRERNSGSHIGPRISVMSGVVDRTIDEDFDPRNLYVVDGSSAYGGGAT